MGDDLVSKMHGDIWCLFKGSDFVIAYPLFASVPIVCAYFMLDPWSLVWLIEEERVGCFTLWSDCVFSVSHCAEGLL